MSFIGHFTPVKSPQSNGISEAFVHTQKRDYVHVSPLRDAAAALALIETWIEDYNDYHPHSGLKMRSPRGFERVRLPRPEGCPVKKWRARLGIKAQTHRQ
ncbi:hypothetical protein NOVOSPHI9U_260252 [Novosphingobium sp. 9U]|nr:hypothetical protein NOVOSPHI9U_260252 [Novosphingobium sp. 9U]